MRHSASILFAEDDEDIRFAGSLVLRQNGFQVEGISDPEQILIALRKQHFQVLLLDMNFRSSIQNGNEGLFWLRQVKKEFPDLAVVMITAFGDIELAVKAMQEGANDFITKPWNNEKLIEVISKAGASDKESKKQKRSTQSSGAFEQLLGESVSMDELRKMIKKVAATDASILLLGENGTGKDLIARAIHELSGRKGKNLVTVDMGAIPESLFESTLFGHKKGAFTDAKEDYDGRFVQADNGTLFLDEIGNIPLHLQSKLLVALQNREVQALGASAVKPVNVRIISATNSNLDERIKLGEFRQDLYYRLNTVLIQIPALREREGDIVALAEAFLENYSETYKRGKLQFSESALKKLKEHPWPGNIRELQHVIERLVILSEGNSIDASDIHLDHSLESRPSQHSSHATLESMEKETIENALSRHRGNISAVASELGLSRAALYRRLSKYKL